ncbi:hypothetical protein [Actinophytocola oryzae]|uniref:Uncharacterized protein n=1 Tax=Actinophytocola oryzae TaxID=502181 RepID=A0A4R7VRC7_9PSEU|nr:hypothetical protein [Actinophytocola oryzae]TDV52212.1 hypothetical protein CLV71_105343 [Actinophytocola oryzae]
MEDGRRWSIETFGAHGVHIRNQVSLLVRDEHTASADAQDASGHRSKSVYGEFWRGILERFEEFGKLPGAALIRPGRAPYNIPVINGVALFPWRYGRSRDRDLTTTPFVTSEARTAMLDLRVATQPELNLGLPRPELTEEEQQLTEVVEAAMADAKVSSNKLVVVAVSSSAIALHDIIWGDVTLSDDGYLDFGFSESLMSLKPSKLFAVPDTGKTFTSGEPPARELGVHGVDEASGDDPSDV